MTIRKFAISLIMIVSIVFSAVGCSTQDTDQRSNGLYERKLLECEERTFELEESFEHRSVPFESEPYQYVAEYCMEKLEG